METICQRFSILIFTIHVFLIPQLGSAQITTQDILHTEIQHGFPAARCMLPASYAHAGFRNDYGLKEMMFGEVEFDFIHHQDAFLVSASHYGYSGFGELAVHIGYGRRFGNKVAVALRGVYLLNHATHYAPRHSFTVDFSAYCQVSRAIGLSVNIYNPIRMKYGVTGNEVIPMVFALQADYQPNEKLILSLYGDKTLPGALDAGIKMFYHPVSNLIISGTAALTHCGIGIFVPWRQLVFSIKADWYYRVSVSTQGGIGYYFEKK